MIFVLIVRLQRSRTRAGGGTSLALALLWQEHRVDVWNDTTRRDRDAAEQLVQFLIVAHSQLDVTRHDTVLLVVARRVAGELQDFCRQVFHDGSQINWRTGTDTSRISALSQMTVNTTDWEL